MEHLDIEKQPSRELPPQKEAESKPAEELIEDLTAEAEVEELGEAEKVAEKIGERLDIPKEEVKEIGRKYGFFEKLSSIKNKISRIAYMSIDKIKKLFEKKEKIFEKTMMETVVESFDKYILKNPDAKAEEIAEFLSKNPENPASPSELELAKIKDIAEYYEKNRRGLKDYAKYLAEKHDVKRIPENPLELLATNKEIKKEFLETAGFGGEVNPDDFMIHLEVPSAIGVGCKQIKDYSAVLGHGEEFACKAEAFYRARPFFTDETPPQERGALKNLTNNIYYLKEGLKNVEIAKIHETQHQIFTKFFSPLAQLEEEYFAYDLSREKTDELFKQSKEIYDEYIEKYKDLERKRQELLKNEIEKVACDELAAYLKEGSYIYDTPSIFGKKFEKETENPNNPTRKIFDKITKELDRLEKDGYNAKDFYPTMVASEDLSEVIKRLKEIK